MKGKLVLRSEYQAKKVCLILNDLIDSISEEGYCDFYRRNNTLSFDIGHENAGKKRKKK